MPGGTVIHSGQRPNCVTAVDPHRRLAVCVSCIRHCAVQLPSTHLQRGQPSYQGFPVMLHPGKGV